MNIKDRDVAKFESVAEERRYWEKRGPLAKGSNGHYSKASPNKELCSSFLTIRLTGAELTQLRDFASKQNIGPSTLVRQIIIQLLKYVQGNSAQVSAPSKSVTLEQVFDHMDKKMPADFKERMETFCKSILLGGGSGQPPFVIIDPAHTVDLQGISIKFLAYLIESINPDIKVITPIDSRYETVKTALAAPSSGHGSEAGVARS